MSDMKCAHCDAAVQPEDAFCQSCGRPVTAPVQETGQQAAAPVTVYVEAPVAFAAGLPAWNIEPPAVVIRRKARI